MQALCVLALAGCARLPVAASGDAARRELLNRLGSIDGPARGSGILTLRRAGEREGGIELRWAASGESLGLVAFAGPVRGLDAALLGDSLFLTVKPYEVGWVGSLASGEDLTPEEARFLLRPWDLASEGIRASIERATVEPAREGWLLRGTLPGREGGRGFWLDLRPDGSPERLRVRRAGGPGDLLTVRYGSLRPYARGRVPRWVEWSLGVSRAKLEVMTEDRAGAPRFRRPRLDPGDGETHALDDPKGREALQRLLGIGGGS